MPRARRGRRSRGAAFRAALVIPLEDDGGLPDPSAATTMPLTGDASYSAGFNANGIAARGGWLVLVQ